MSIQPDEVAVQLINQKVQFRGVSKANPGRPIAFDYPAPLGDGQGFNGLELLLMSLAGCSATALVYLLRKKGKTVSGLDVQAKGLRSAQPPLKFDRIFLEFKLQSPDAQAADLQQAVQLAEASVCPVWQLLKNNVEVVPSFSLNA